MGTLGWVVLVATVGLLFAGGYFWLRTRSPRQQKEGPQEHFKCPNCGRRLGYLPRQAGHTGRCPRCRHPLTFPK